MKLEIVNYGHPALREKGETLSSVDAALGEFAASMLETMYAASGVGLAAQQVARAIMLCVVDVPVELDVDEDTGERLNPEIEMPLALVNPVLSAGEGSQTGTEGCLSFPDIQLQVKRDFAVTVSFLDLEGNARELRAKGFLARAIQHEVDHLNGVLFIDRVPEFKKLSVAGKLKRLRKQTLEDLANPS